MKTTEPAKPKRLALRHWLNHDPAEAINYEFPQLPSVAVPDMTLSIKTLIEKHTLNQPINANVREPIYNGDVFVPNYAALDLAERQELAEGYEAEASELRETAKKEIAEKRAKKEAADREENERKRLLEDFAQSQKKKDEKSS